MHSSDMMYHYRFLISEQAKYPLINVRTGEPLKVVEHIGCHYSKIFPSKSVGGAEYPRVLAGLVEALGGSVVDYGGSVVDYPERRHCCGFGFRQYLVKANRGYSLTNTYKKFESMEPFHPDLIITNCPGCNYFWLQLLPGPLAVRHRRDHRQDLRRHPRLRHPRAVLRGGGRAGHGLRPLGPLCAAGTGYSPTAHRRRTS